MVKKSVNILVTGGLIAYMIFALGFTSAKETEVLCSQLSIRLKDSLNSGFYNKADIEALLVLEKRDILGYPLHEINTRELEKLLNENPYIKNVEIYSNIDGKLSIDIEQRKPILRVITWKQNSYYLDEDGYILKAYGNFTPHILVASGYITESAELEESHNLDQLKENDRYKEWQDLHQLALFIDSDSFWSHQIVQLYFNDQAEFEIIPRVGAHQIILGRSNDYPARFRKLRILYEEGLKYEGWNKYDRINLKFDNQVICTKR